ncbi:MAG: MBL fold metallo-hydrolase [Bacilli bacterium]|nr:MBL fold metallo-hydrolase [Bacilli bacterium]
MRISILSNDRSRPGFFAEHGLSLYINHPLYNILFDTGQSSSYLQNAIRMGIEIRDTEFVVLSHGHYDHMGGLIHFPSVSQVKRIIFHKDAFLPKYAKEEKDRYNGVPYQLEQLPKTMNEQIQMVGGFSEIAPGFYVLGDILHEIKQTKYYVNSQLDDFHDEMILILEEDKHLTLFMGCSHYGVIEGLQAVIQRFPNRKIRNIIAGMHLEHAEETEIRTIASFLSQLNLSYLIPIHCTGDKAQSILKEVFQEKCLLLKAGDQIHV